MIDRLQTVSGLQPVFVLCILRCAAAAVTIEADRYETGLGAFRPVVKQFDRKRISEEMCHAYKDD